MQPLASDLAMLAETAVNRALQRDPYSCERLNRLAGRVLRCQLSFPALTLTIGVEEPGCLRFMAAAEAVDCHVEAGSADLLQWVLSGEQGLPEGIRVRGDSALLHQLMDIVRDLDLDWEGLLGDQIGDLAAHPIFQAGRWLQQQLQQNNRLLSDDLEAYLHDELRVLPVRDELAYFYDQVDELRLATDRLQARIRRLTEQASLTPDA